MPTVRERLCHAHNIDPELQKSCRIITGTLKPTSLPALFRLAGIQPSFIRREIITKIERHKELIDSWHSLYGHQEVRKRLKFHKSFLTIETLNQISAVSYRLERWQEWECRQHNEVLPSLDETLSLGSNMNSRDWVTLKRAWEK